jgi:hypothetical protein
VSANANTTPFPSSASGPGIVIKLSDLDAGLIKGFNSVFVNRLYRLARFFVTFFEALRRVFFAAFLALPFPAPWPAKRLPPCS